MATGAKSFSDAPPTKFGVQAGAIVRITLWPNDKYSTTSEKFILKGSSYRTLEQLHAAAAKKLKLMPSLRGIYRANGKRVKELTDFEDGKHYIAVQTGAKFDATRLPGGFPKAK